MSDMDAELLPNTELDIMFHLTEVIELPAPMFQMPLNLRNELSRNLFVLLEFVSNVVSKSFLRRRVFEPLSLFQELPVQT